MGKYNLRKFSALAVLSTTAFSMLVTPAFAKVTLQNGTTLSGGLTVKSSTTIDVQTGSQVQGNVTIEAPVTITADATAKENAFANATVTLKPTTDGAIIDLGGVTTNKLVIGNEKVSEVKGFVPPASGVEAAPGASKPTFKDESDGLVSVEIPAPALEVVDVAAGNAAGTKLMFDSAVLPTGATKVMYKVLDQSEADPQPKLDEVFDGNDEATTDQDITNGIAVGKKLYIVAVDDNKKIKGYKVHTLIAGDIKSATAPTEVILAEGSLGTAGDGVITGLASGKKYKVTVGTGATAAVKYVKADGTLSDQAADAAALVGTEITGLTNGETYKVEEIIDLPTEVILAEGSLGTAGDGV
ncbi:hypothetical protein QYF48_02660, partial [Brevibacillus agri]|uniref:hypothetical protein n=1 Tax=Brevibacillus agri TaxID=51101 RepID=UPI0025B6B660